MNNNFTIKTSNAFVEHFLIEPYKNGTLDGLSFAVKDNIDIKGYKTSYGSKPWKDMHAKAVYNALCIDQILNCGAKCIGKTIADEFTYSLEGESYFFGTPLNPKAPDHVPGGSSSGSASAVACGLVDFSIGTDSAGSIRVPASLCGIWGMRPSLHRISEAGVLPFMPSVSTVGAFSNNIYTLEKVMRVLLRSENKEKRSIKNIYLLNDAFLIADASVRKAIESSILHLNDREGISLIPIKLSEIVGDHIDLNICNSKALRVLQTAEFSNTVGGWIETVNPELGPGFTASYNNVKNFDRTDLNEALFLCEKFYSKIKNFINDSDLFLFPTTPTVAPRKGALNNHETVLDFYDRTMAITSFAGIGRLPEISIPITSVNKIPVGLSIAAGQYQDEFLLSASRDLFGNITA
ncbi:amidase family protein [Xanthovirga aplysinae]|uniref:amidase family protein n=1 Tax=Xanthovirga aplysinae TaxID=2529853 RepID=UPI0012BCE7FB|nr:amidase family protein [Xanthovirga aplysinae]MTI30881.1 glutamyl-tRNA amidotransferase [Xanthovirga aplysinae]